MGESTLGTQSADVPPSSPPIASLAIIRYLPHLVPIPKRLHTTYTPLQIRTATPHQTPGHHLRPATARPAWNGEPSLHRMAIVTSLARQRLLSRSTVLYWWWLTLGMARPPPSCAMAFVHLVHSCAGSRRNSCTHAVVEHPLPRPPHLVNRDSVDIRSNHIWINAHHICYNMKRR